MKIFLLMGQSNMAGRAKPLDADRIPAPNAYKMNREDKWSPATPPLHYDKKVAGYGPADAFIRAYLAEHPGESAAVRRDRRRPLASGRDGRAQDG